ncbi:hypothetical protein FCV25MIE_01852 [Fagus crenata]
MATTITVPITKQNPQSTDPPKPNPHKKSQYPLPDPQSTIPNTATPKKIMVLVFCSNNVEEEMATGVVFSNDYQNTNLLRSTRFAVLSGVINVVLVADLVSALPI